MFTLILAGVVLCQTGTTEITGIVVDTSGTAISNAQIKVKNQGTRKVSTATTDESGAFVIPGIHLVNILFLLSCRDSRNMKSRRGSQWDKQTG